MCSMSEASAAQLRRDILTDFEQLMQHVARWRQVDMADVDVTMLQARCLLLVALHPSMSISTLASHLHVGLPAASGLVDRLVENGYLERNVDPDDRRHQLVTLSAGGRRLVERLHELSSERFGDLLPGLSLDELRGLRIGVAALEREAGAIAEEASDPAVPSDPERTHA
jgi:DNA-binding MarR family transcriptional regulator